MFSSIRCPQCTADTGYLVPLSPGHPELSDKQEDWRCVSCGNTQQAKFVNAVTQVQFSCVFTARTSNQFTTFYYNFDYYYYYYYLKLPLFPDFK